MPGRANNIPAKRLTASAITALALLLLTLGMPAAARYNDQVQGNPTNQANPWTEDVASDVGIIQQLNDPLPAGLTPIDEDGNPVELSSFYKTDRPIVLNLGYGRCPSICPRMRMQLVDTLAEADLELGEDFIVLNISIDPQESPASSRWQRDQAFSALKEKGVDAPRAGWRFLTADAQTIKTLTDALGYRYLYIEPQNEYGHPGVLVLTDGDGVIKRYFNGTAYSATSFRRSIVEVSQGKAGDVWDQVFLTCFVWDPDANNYSATAKFIMMIGGGVTILLIGGLVLAGFAYEKRRRKLNEKDNRLGEALPTG